MINRVINRIVIKSISNCTFICCTKSLMCPSKSDKPSH